MPAPAPSATPPPRPGAEPLRALIVDDEPSVRMVARLMMERAGYAVTEAGAAGEALAQVQGAAQPFAVVLLDVTLPDRIGTDVIADLRRLAPHSRVILTSGRAEEDLPDHGADGYLPKPFTKEQLLAAVRLALNP